MITFFLGVFLTMILATLTPGILVISQGVIAQLAKDLMWLSLWLTDLYGAIENGKQAYYLRRRARVVA